MKFVSKILTIAALAAVTPFAQLAPEPPMADVKLMQDSTTNQPMKMDFSKPLSGISDPGILFSHFANKPLLISTTLVPNARTASGTFPKSRTWSRNMSPRA